MRTCRSRSAIRAPRRPNLCVRCAHQCLVRSRILPLAARAPCYRTHGRPRERGHPALDEGRMPSFPGDALVPRGCPPSQGSLHPFQHAAGETLGARASPPSEGRMPSFPAGACKKARSGLVWRWASRPGNRRPLPGFRCGGRKVRAPADGTPGNAWEAQAYGKCHRKYTARRP